ncbi:MAG: hypothetical protein ABIE14_03795, partial [Patescibacteria group bacterium]
MQTQKTFQNFPETFARERRLVFENANNAGADTGSEKISLIASDYSSVKEFEKNLVKAVAQKEIDEDKKNQLLADARNRFAEKENADKKQSREKNTFAKIEELKNK